MTYTALASDQINQARLDWRGRKHATRCHALIFTTVEAQGMGIFDMSRDEVVDLVFEQAKVVGFWGFLINPVIFAVITKLVAIVFDWLIGRLQAWIDRNRTHANFGEAMSRASVMAELQPLFAGAREVLA